MRILNLSDYLEISNRSLVADYDYETLINLYQPIIGHTAISVYLSMLFESKNQKIYSLIKHKDLLMRMQLNSGDFIEARKRLEAIGLLRSFYAKQKEVTVYHYELFAPRTPAQFFDNSLLYGMLIKCLGDEEAKKLKSLYVVNNSTNFGEEISSKFTEIFHPEFDDKSFAIAFGDENNSKGRNLSVIQGVFSYELFFKSLGEISNIKEDDFTKKEMKEIYRIATLYGVNEYITSNHVANIFDPNAPKGKHIDLSYLNKLLQREGDYNFKSKSVRTKKNLITGDTDLAKKINFMEVTSPKKYLEILQGGTKPALPDLRLIDDLSKNFGLANGVINAVIDYVLDNCNNILSRPYAEKIAASIAREGIESTLDAMNYLIKTTKKQKTSNKNVEENEIKGTKNDQTNDNEEIEKQRQKLIEELGLGEDDGEAEF